MKKGKDIVLYYLPFDEDLIIEMEIELSPEEIEESAWNLANRYFNITGRKDLEYFVLDEDRDTVVAALYASIDSEEMNFDVVVHENYQRRGVASQLVDMVLEDYKMNLEAYPDQELVCMVINPCVLGMLKKKGFRVDSTLEGNFLMIYS